MNSGNAARDQARRRRRRKVSFFGILALLGMGAFIYWLAPHSHREVHTVDGQHGWDGGAAPPQRGIVWQPAKPVEATTTQAESEDSRIRPQLTEDGTTLYFTRRKADGSKDIYRRRLVDSVWQEAAPVAELNTLADDIGPVITPDGKTLYLYSDRVGGQGGLDLYVSQKTSDGWSKPHNLGERINSPAHEYDAAVSSDGRKLFFASNRSEKMHRQLREGKFDEDGKHWKTTLRADLGRNTFDLYMARRERASQEWNHAQPLASLNREKTNEGAPYVSPNDSFVYFSSDRNVRAGEETNFDIFRARIRGNSVGPPENLGIGVNTAANEHEPSLSAEGFRLYFSRNRIEDEDHPADDSQYDLYNSLAAEVEDTTYWDDGNVQALAPLINFLLENLWWIIMTLLFAAFLAALRYFIRSISWRRAPIPGFLLAAILLHLLLAGGSFYVVFKPQIDDVIDNIKEKVIVASRPHDEDPFDEIKPPKQPFEEVADIKTPDTVVPSNVPKQVTEAPSMPTPINAKVPTVEIRVSPDTVPNKVTPTQQPDTPRPIQDLALPRQRPAPTDTQETIKLEQAQSQSIVEQRIEQQQVNVNPRELTPTKTDAPVMKRRPITTPLEFVQEQIPVEKVPTKPVESEVGNENSLVARRTAVQVPSSENTRINSEALEAVTPNVIAPSPKRVTDVKADRQQAVAPAPTSSTLELPRRAPSNIVGGPSASEQAPERVPVIPGIQSVELNAKIKRIRTELADTLGNTEAVRIETTGQPIPISTPTQTQPKGVVVNQSRQQTNTVTPGTPSLNLPITKRSISHLPRATHIAPQRVTSAATALLASPSIIGDAPTRRRSLEVASLPAGEIEIEQASSGATTEVHSNHIEGGQQVGATRAASTPVDFQIASSDSFAGTTTIQPAPGMDRLARELIDSPIAFSSLAGRNTLARASRISDIPGDDQSIQLLATLSLRKADARAKEKLLEKYKGDPRTLPAIQDGLTWINQHQFEDGHWSLHEFDKTCKNHDGKKCRGKGLPSDTAATGLALLPFLGDGQTHLEGHYKETIRKGLQWLVKNQVRDGNPKKDGDLFVSKNKNKDNARMYSHGIATIALCEAYALSRDETLRDPAQRAINFIVHTQHKGTGGWRYQPNQSADTSVVGWQVMALKSGQMADLVVPQETLDGVKGWFRKIGGKGKDAGKYGYQGGYSVTMTAEALLCMEYLGTTREDIEIQKGADILLQNLPKRNRETSYYWYYGTQTMFHMQGEHWEQWNGAINKMLIDTQQKKGTLKGTWDPKDKWEGSGGRIYATSLRVLMLEVYFRHLPLYKVLNP